MMMCLYVVLFFLGDLDTTWWIRRFTSASAFIIYPRRRFAWEGALSWMHTCWRSGNGAHTWEDLHIRRPGWCQTAGLCWVLQNSLHIFYEAIYKCSMKRFSFATLFFYERENYEVEVEKVAALRRCGVAALLESCPRDRPCGGPTAHTVFGNVNRHFHYSLERTIGRVR